MNYDVIIIGGGPAGYKAGLELSKTKLNVLLIEKEKIGGTCLNVGCIPTKSILNSAFNNLDFESIVDKRNSDVSKLVNGLSYQIKKSGIDYINGCAYIIGKENDVFLIRVDDVVYTSYKLIIATGSSPKFFDIPGLDQSLKSGYSIDSNKFLTYDKEFPDNIAIIGGGVIGIEFATFLAKLGKNVTIFEAKNKLLYDVVDDEIISIEEENLEKLGINILCNVKIAEISNSDVVYELEGDYDEMSFDLCVIVTGRMANVVNIGLENIGIDSTKSIQTNEYCETTIKNVYAIGDVNGKNMLAHVAYKEAEVAVMNILGNKACVSYNAIPNVVFSNPILSFAGYNEYSCKKNDIKYYVKKCSMLYSSMYTIKYGSQKGICKLIFSTDDVIIGAELIGNGSDELIFILSDWISCKLHLSDIKNKIYPHPSIVEIIKEAINS